MRRFSYDIKNHPLTININFVKHINVLMQIKIINKTFRTQSFYGRGSADYKEATAEVVKMTTNLYRTEPESNNTRRIAIE